MKRYVHLLCVFGLVLAAIPVDTARAEAPRPDLALPTVGTPIAPQCASTPTYLPQSSAECPATGRRAVAVRVGRIAVEALLGVGLGAIVGVLGAYGGLNVDLALGRESGAGLSLGTALGATLGVAPGVWLGGRALGGDGSFGWTLLGSALGTGLSAGLLAISDKPEMMGFAATVPVAAAIVAYELSSHTRRAPKVQAERLRPLQATVLPAFGPAYVGLSGSF